ncbi:MAG: hypothetical protein WC806_06625 [Candidatus Gracilibacteria bacterium]|jgi:outer membrane murein-binding lipoprotein Lpp
MKKFLIGLSVLSILLMSGCTLPFSDSAKDKQIEDLSAKIDDLQKQIEDKTPATKPAEEIVPTETPAETTPPADTTIKTDYTGDNYITLNSPLNEASFTEEPIVFTGVISPNTTKILTNWTGIYPVGDDSPLTDSYKLQNFKYGDTTFKYSAKVSYKNLLNGTNKYEFKAYFDDGTTKSANVQIYYTVGGAEMGKPVIYLYPEKTTKVSVNVQPQAGISVSVPEIGKGWNVIASPNGKLLNSTDLKTYPYLFWEGFASTFVRPSEGFVVEKKGIINFFDEKLAILGLNNKEIVDFKEYWIPKLEKDPYYFITFVPQKEFNKYAPLTITPTPDTIIRVFFDYQGLSEKKVVTEQKLEKRERKGFSVIEWGGRLY